MTTAPDARALRTFGFLVGGVFLLLGTWPILAHRAGPRTWALAAAVLLVVPALVYPRALGPAHRIWIRMGHALGWVNTRIILTFTFYAIVTPIGLVRRWLGRDPMRRGFDRGAGSYRVPREARPASHLRRQF